jgi:hypothetical protein
VRERLEALAVLQQDPMEAQALTGVRRTTRVAVTVFAIVALAMIGGMAALFVTLG